MALFLINALYELSSRADGAPDGDLNDILNHLLYEDDEAPTVEMFEWLSGHTHSFALEIDSMMLSNDIYIRVVLDIPDTNTALHFRMRFPFPLAKPLREDSGFAEEEDEMARTLKASGFLDELAREL